VIAPLVAPRATCRTLADGDAFWYCGRHSRAIAGDQWFLNLPAASASVPRAADQVASTPASVGSLGGTAIARPGMEMTANLVLTAERARASAGWIGLGGSSDVHGAWLPSPHCSALPWLGPRSTRLRRIAPPTTFAHALAAVA